MNIIIPSLGEYGSAFSFEMQLTDVTDTANVLGYIDGKKFYQLNFASNGTFTVRVTETTLSSLGGGLHTISFTGNDTSGTSATASQTFTKTFTYPIVAVASNMGDKSGAFAVNYSIKNVLSERPTLTAYMDSTSNVIVQLPDASSANSVTIDAETFDGLSEGSHTVIIVVTNAAGSTTKNTSFNKVTQDENYTGLKLGYSDDTWGGVENRIYTESTVTYEGNSYKSFVDETPYDTEGEPVTGALLAAMSRGVQNANASNTVSNMDGSMTETSANGTSVITASSDGYTEVFTDKEGNTLTKTTFFNADGSIAESTTYTKGN